MTEIEQLRSDLNLAVKALSLIRDCRRVYDAHGIAFSTLGRLRLKTAQMEQAPMPTDEERMKDLWILGGQR